METLNNSRMVRELLGYWVVTKTPGVKYVEYRFHYYTHILN